MEEVSDHVAEYQTAKTQMTSAKRKIDKYNKTLKKIHGQGVKLGEIAVIEETNSSAIFRIADNLSKLIKPKPSAFCCGGWVEMSASDAKARLKMKDDKTNQNGWPISDIPVDKLLKFCAQAPYGDLERQETVFNPDVRLAHECVASKFHFAASLEGKPLYYFDSSIVPQFLIVIAEKVKSTLANGKDVSLQCYKMNVYGKGGFFSAHVDTPVDAARMIGTVVICLPSKHTGGVLKVQHKGIKEEFKFADLSGDGGKIQWAAFYSDCVHEILPVQDGHRITVTYNILQELSWQYSDPGTCKSDSFCEGQAVATTKAGILDKIVADISKLSTDEKVSFNRDGGLERFGIFLRHKYTMSALELGHLKGCDQVLYAGLTSRGLTCQLQTVLVHELNNKIDAGEENNYRESEEHDVFSFSGEDMLFVNNQGPEPPHASWKQMSFIKEWSKETVLIERSNKQGRNCGNYIEPGQTDRLYLQSVVIIKLPSDPENPRE